MNAVLDAILSVQEVLGTSPQGGQATVGARAGAIETEITNARMGETDIKTAMGLLVKVLGLTTDGGIVSSGFATSAGAGLSVNVASGTGITREGILVKTTGTSAVSVSPNTTNYIYFTNSSTYASTTTLATANAGLYVASVVTGAGSVTSVTDRRRYAPRVATTSLDGPMSAADKTKLDGIEALAQPNQNAFTTVTVSGQNNVVADAVSDTLTFMAGTAMVITTDSSTDTVTITADATSAGGTETGKLARTHASTGRVGDSQLLQGYAVTSLGGTENARVAVTNASGKVGAALIADEATTIKSIGSLPAAGSAGRLLRLTSDNQIYMDISTGWLRALVADTNGGVTVDTNSLVINGSTHTVGVGASPSGSYKFEVTGTGKVSTSLTTPIVLIGTGSDGLKMQVESSNLYMRDNTLGDAWWMQLRQGSGGGIDVFGGTSRVGTATFAIAGALTVAATSILSGDTTISKVLDADTRYVPFRSNGTNRQRMTFAATSHNLSFETYNGTTWVEAMRVAGTTGNTTIGTVTVDRVNGYVGINQATPAYVLDVSGAIRMAGTITGLTGLTTSGNASIGGTLAVTGATTLSSTLDVTGATVISGALSGSSTLSITGAATFGSTVQSSNTVTLTSTQSGGASNSPALILRGWSGVAASNTYIQAVSSGGWKSVNNANTTTTFQVTDNGNTTITGSLTATGGNTTLAAATMSSGTVTGAFTVGTTLGVTGAATLSSTLGVTGAVILNSTLGVTGAATLSSTLNVTGATVVGGALSGSSTLAITGAATFSSTVQANNSVLITGVQSGIASHSPALQLRAWSGTVGSSAYLQALSTGGWRSVNNANTTTTFQVTDAGNVTVAGTLTVSGASASLPATTVASESVTGALTVGTTLGVTGATTLSSTLGVSGTTTLSSTLSVTGATTLSSTLGVSGTATFSGGVVATASVSILTTLAVTQNVSFGSELGVTGQTYLNGGATVPTGYKLTLADSPAANTDAANKSYVDTTISNQVAPKLTLYSAAGGF